MVERERFVAARGTRHAGLAKKNKKNKNKMWDKKRQEKDDKTYSSARLTHLRCSQPSKGELGLLVIFH